MPTYRRDPDDPKIVHVEGVEHEPYAPLPWRSYLLGLLTGAVVFFPILWAFGVIGG